FWSALYVWFRSPVVNITSHVAWDISVFVLWPFV
ncbi:MAG: CPBP family intramembrane metalloprotease, partial [Deltaproteobacteria bacterium]